MGRSALHVALLNYRHHWLHSRTSEIFNLGCYPEEEENWLKTVDALFKTVQS
jgi:hypothetical protein